MSIQIIDGFRLNVATPVDDRMVTSGTSSRNSIAYKYEGLRVFDTAQKTAFVWIDNAWQKESETSVSTGVIPGLAGTQNKLLRFITATKVGDSTIFDNGINVGIGTPTPDADFKLDVNGNVKAAAFHGNGTLLTAIDASKITTGALAIARIANGGSNQILASGTSVPQWIDISSLSTGTVNVTNDTANTSNQYINFTNATTGATSIKVSSTGLLFNPSKGQILLGAGSAANPAYSFTDNNNDTGIYRIANEKSIGFSTNGTVKMVIRSNGNVEIYNSTSISGTTTMSGLATMNGGATIAGTTAMATATISGTTTMSGLATMNGGATIAGTTAMATATISGTTTMSGLATMNGGATIAGTTAMATATISDTLKVTGDLTLEGKVYFNAKALRMKAPAQGAEPAYDSQMISLTKYGLNLIKYIYNQEFTVPKNSTDANAKYLSDTNFTFRDQETVSMYTLDVGSGRFCSAATYDRNVSVSTGGSAGRTNVDITLHVYHATFGGYRLAGRALQYSSLNVIIPAGCTWTLKCENSDTVNSNTFYLIISKFGTQKQDSNFTG